LRSDVAELAGDFTDEGIHHNIPSVSVSVSVSVAGSDAEQRFIAGF
jgi:hypothetical protein